MVLFVRLEPGALVAKLVGVVRLGASVTPALALKPNVGFEAAAVVGALGAVLESAPKLKPDVLAGVAVV